MAEAAPFISALTHPGKRGKRTAYLIAVHQRREAPRVYAVVAQSAEAALAQLADLATNQATLEIVGALSRDLTRRLHLKPGEMRLV